MSAAPIIDDGASGDGNASGAQPRESRVSRESIVVTIDGPAGAGKSTVAKQLAQALGYRLLDTGALYRTVALLARERGIDWADEAGLAALCDGLEVGFRWEGEVNHVLVAGRDVTTLVRAPEISLGASQVSAHPGVRQGLLELQRRLGREGGVVVEGRDVGTVVFPDAGAKFFLTASDEVRARRRFEELALAGPSASPVSFEQTLEEIRTRDERDRNRAVAPLVQAADAVLVDSSNRTVEAVVAGMLAIVREREADAG